MPSRGRTGPAAATPGAGQPAEEARASRAPAKPAKPAATAGAVAPPEAFCRPGVRITLAGGALISRCPHIDRYGHDPDKCATVRFWHLARERGAEVCDRPGHESRRPAGRLRCFRRPDPAPAVARKNRSSVGQHDAREAYD